MNYENQRVMITAAASGIGAAIARRFAAQGAHVHACDVDPTTVERFAGTNPVIAMTALDASDEAAVDGWFDTALADLGGLDVLVNCAGTAGPTASVEDMDFAEWKRCIDVNLDAAFLCCRRASPAMKAAGGGAIVNFSSVSGLHGYPNRSPYCTAKWGVIGFTKTLAIELGPAGIRVNAICPGPVEGERMDRVIAAEALKTGQAEDAIRSMYTDETSLKTFVTADDMADMVLFLASPAAKHVSGQALPVDAHTSSL